MGDEQLLQRATAGDHDAVRELLDTSGPVVFGFVMARVGGDRSAADDIVQDTFLEAMRSAHTFRAEAALTTWMCAIARRRVARHFEAERREELAREQLRPDLERVVPEADAELPAVESHDEIVRALGRLPVLHRQVLVLKYLDGRPVREIADDLGRTVVQIQSLLQRARVSLRKELQVVA